MRLVVAELGDDTPLIGFAGAPFTLAAYLVEGRGSRDHLAARSMLHAEPAALAPALLDWCADLSERFPHRAGRRRRPCRPVVRLRGRAR